MANPSDFVTVGEARFDLRVDADQADDATLSRYVEQAVDLVARTTGRDLLALDAADIAPGLKTCVSFALWLVFEKTAATPRAFYDVCAPYRRFVADA